MTAPTDRLTRRMRQDFGRGTDDAVIRRLTALSPDDSSERIQAALVLAARGRWRLFAHQLRHLELDWRNVLVAGGLADADWPTRLAAELPAGDGETGRSAARTGAKPSAKPRAPRPNRHGVQALRRPSGGLR